MAGKLSLAPNVLFLGGMNMKSLFRGVLLGCLVCLLALPAQAAPKDDKTVKAVKDLTVAFSVLPAEELQDNTLLAADLNKAILAEFGLQKNDANAATVVEVKKVTGEVVQMPGFLAGKDAVQYHLSATVLIRDAKTGVLQQKKLLDCRATVQTEVEAYKLALSKAAKQIRLYVRGDETKTATTTKTAAK